MQIRVDLISNKKSKKIMVMRRGSTAFDLIKSLSLKPDIWIVTRNNSPIPIDEKLNNGDRIKLISVVSGG